MIPRLFALTLVLALGASDARGLVLADQDAVVITQDNSVWQISGVDGSRTLITDGSTIGTGPALTSIGHVVVDSEGRIYVATEDNTVPGSIWEVDAVTGDRRVVSDSTQGTGEVMLTIRDIAMLANGDVAAIGARELSPAARNGIWRIDPVSGDRVLITAALGALPNVGSGDFGLFAADMDISGSDLILVPNVSGDVMQITVPGGVRTRFSAVPPHDFVLGVAFESPFSAILVDTGDGEIVRIAPDNSTEAVLSSSTNGSGPFWGFDLTGGVDIGTNGIYVTVEGSTPGVYLVDPVTGDRTYFSPFPAAEPGVIDVGVFNLLTCEDELDVALATIAALQVQLDLCVHPDEDNDGVDNEFDTCPGTPIGSQVDAQGCSLDQFCGQITVTQVSNIFPCFALDFMDDEPELFPGDCRVQGPWSSPTCVGDFF